MSRLTYALVALILTVGTLVGLRVSSAEFTDGSVSRTEVGAARDWTPPVVSVDDPGFVVTGSVSVTATASDADTSVASVRIEVAPQASSSWTELCTDTGSPWSCSWDTTTMADGDYKVRAVATDVDGNAATSSEVSTTVSNTTAIVLDPVPSPIRGNITLTARITNPGPFSTYIKFQGSPAGANTWVDVPGTGCAGSGATRTCVFDSSLAADGTYDWRAVGTVGGWQTYYDYQRDIVVDNTVPTVTQSVPTGYLSGTVNWTATAADNLSGVESVTFDYRLASGGWLTCATDASAPYSCSVDASALADGSYEFRATAADVAGNTTTTATVTRSVDNEGPALTLDVPAGPISGPVAMTATATDAGAGMGWPANVQFQYRLEAAASWTNCGTDYFSPYACSTGSIADGTYEFRAIATNANGLSTTSPIETRVVETVIASVAVTAPAAGSTIWGSTTVTASASSNKGVNSVTLQYSTGAGWTDLCTDNSSPYSCPWDASTLPYGTYQLQAVMSHGSGLTQTSAGVNVVVPQPGGYDVQGTASPNGLPAAGERLTLTYTDTMNLSTIASGLTTSSGVATTVSFVGASPDRLTFGAGVNLGTIYFASNQDYVDAGRTVRFNATITAGTTNVNGIAVTRITVTLGSRIDALSWLADNDGSGDMLLVPSGTAEDTAWNAASTATVTESGAADRDF